MQLTQNGSGRNGFIRVGRNGNAGVYASYHQIECGFNIDNQPLCRNRDTKRDISPAAIIPLLPYILNQDVMKASSALHCNLEFCSIDNGELIAVGAGWGQPVGRVQPEMAEYMKRNFEFKKKGVFNSMRGSEIAYEVALMKEREERKIIPADTQQAKESLVAFDRIFGEGNSSAYGDDFVLNTERKFLGRYPLFDDAPDCSAIENCQIIKDSSWVDYDIEQAFRGMPYVLNSDVASSIDKRLLCSTRFCFRAGEHYGRAADVPVGLVQPVMIPWMKKHCTPRFPSADPVMGAYLCSQEVPYLESWN